MERKGKALSVELVAEPSGAGTPGRTDDPGRRAPTRTTTVLGNVIAVSFVFLILVLGVRSILASDARFGWRTFSGHVQFQVDYYWHFKDGTRIRYVPGEELKGNAATHLRVGSHQAGYDTGAMKIWVCTYAKWVYQNRAWDRVAAFEAHVTHRLNRMGPWESEVLAYPAYGQNTCD